MIKRFTLLALLMLATTAFAIDSELTTRAEHSGFLETSLYAEAIDFVNQAASRCPKLRVGILGTSAGGLTACITGVFCRVKRREKRPS